MGRFAAGGMLFCSVDDGVYGYGTFALMEGERLFRANGTRTPRFVKVAKNSEMQIILWQYGSSKLAGAEIMGISGVVL